MSRHRHDVVAFGATSFVGRLLCRHLLERHGTGGERLRWAIAGRSADRMAELRHSLGLDAAHLPILVADAADAASLRELCAQARIVVSTVGPYALHGEPLVRACAESGTDYLDLSGETLWMRRMIGRYSAEARRSGARIVHACGFDSIPSDLGVHVLQREALRRFGLPCEHVSMRVRALRGAVSGGTAASALEGIRAIAWNRALRREAADPYLLCGENVADRVRQPRVPLAAFDPDFGAWAAPFVMGPVNRAIVLRSHVLGGGAYGAAFRYEEAQLTGRGLRGRLTALGFGAGLAGFYLAAAVPPMRWLLRRFVLPAPGEGPSAQAQRDGFFDLRFLGRANDTHLRLQCVGERDPGYGATARMLGESAACLALDLPESGRTGGFWTPATLLGDRLVERLRDHAGVRFNVLDD